MSSVVTFEKPASTTTPQRRFSFVRRRWFIVSVAGAIFAVIVYIAVLALNWPFTEQAVVDILQERSLRSVTIERFYRTYFPPGCVAEGISFLHRKHKNKAPLIAIQRLVIVGSYSKLLTVQRRLSLVRVFGMHVTVPSTQPGEPNPIMPLTHSNSGSSMVIDKLVADGATLDFLSRDPGKKPFELIIDKLALHGVGNNLPMSYRTIISDTVPPGKIRSTGKFGPWNPDNPGITPVVGSYTFQDANLAFFQGISGTLSSSGNFSGTLGNIAAKGTADVPNFKVTDTSHSRRLAARFQALIDGTNGDTTLQDVVAHFDRTTVVSKGSVAGRPGEKGKTASLDLFAANGRIEDFLDLFISARQAPMTGNINFHAHVELPPGPQPFVTKLKMQGDFGLGAGKFTDRATQSDLDRLSESAQKRDKARHENPETVLSDLKGHVAANNGMATLSDLSFAVPGAKALIHGTYRLTDYQVNLHGTLITTGKPSEATTGFKSFLVKAITPFFKKKAKAKIVPFKVTGNYGNTAVALDLGAKEK